MFDKFKNKLYFISIAGSVFFFFSFFGTKIITYYFPYISKYIYIIKPSSNIETKRTLFLFLVFFLASTIFFSVHFIYNYKLASRFRVIFDSMIFFLFSFMFFILLFIALMMSKRFV